MNWLSNGEHSCSGEHGCSSPNTTAAIQILLWAHRCSHPSGSRETTTPRMTAMPSMGHGTRMEAHQRSCNPVAINTLRRLAAAVNTLLRAQ